jgi:hypothetical protein
MENKIILYQTEQNNVTVNVVFQDESFWLTQKAMSELFGVESHTITYHLKEIFQTGELQLEATARKIRVVQQEGNRSVSRELDFYNLDAIIAVGYRVNSKQATQFRIWATNTLKEYIIKGFVMNDELLKNGKPFGADYFEELLERIREIRASERRVYQKLTDIFEQCSIDFSPKADETKLFYAIVQNKLHFAITGQTAAEIVHSRADRNERNMGLSTWKNAPKGKIMKNDVRIAKNYLSEDEIKDLNLLVNAYLDLAEFQARRHITMSMNDWIKRTNKFLESNSLDILPNAGHISHEQAMDKAEREYEAFRIEQDKQYISNFDEVMEKLQNKNKQ